MFDYIYRNGHETSLKSFVNIYLFVLTTTTIFLVIRCPTFAVSTNTSITESILVQTFIQWIRAREVEWNLSSCHDPNQTLIQKRRTILCTKVTMKQPYGGVSTERVPQGKKSTYDKFPLWRSIPRCTYIFLSRS